MKYYCSLEETELHAQQEFIVMDTTQHDMRQGNTTQHDMRQGNTATIEKLGHDTAGLQQLIYIFTYILYFKHILC